jgi:hypothetical protein
MASTLEDLIAAQRAQADVQGGKLVQQQKEGEAALQTETGEVNPLYDKLISDTQTAYQGNLDKARTSASEAGVYRSGIRYNKELQLGSAAAQQTGEYGAERTRKLADISRRRTLLASNVAQGQSEIQAGLGTSIAETRYKDYQQQEAMRLEREKMAQQAAQAAAALKAQYDTTKPDRASVVSAIEGDLGSLDKNDIDKSRQSLYNKYKDLVSRQEIDSILRSKGFKQTNQYAGATGSSLWGNAYDYLDKKNQTSWNPLSAGVGITQSASKMWNKLFK